MLFKSSLFTVKNAKFLIFYIVNNTLYFPPTEYYSFIFVRILIFSTKELVTQVQQCMRAYKNLPFSGYHPLLGIYGSGKLKTFFIRK
jgi:hypothetical protein